MPAAAVQTHLLCAERGVFRSRKDLSSYMSIGHERDTQAFFFESGTLPSTPDDESGATLERAEADRRSVAL